MVSILLLEVQAGDLVANLDAWSVRRQTQSQLFDPLLKGPLHLLVLPVWEYFISVTVQHGEVQVKKQALEEVVEWLFRAQTDCFGDPYLQI